MNKPVFLAIVALSLAVSFPALAIEPPAAAARTVCDDIAEAAHLHNLPLDYFTRLIWRESGFRKDAVSPAGAQGIAQFMPRTAAGRGLADPFAVHEAIFQSAGYLDELRASFGNLGLAAAGYNAGPGRLAKVLAGDSVLPQETEDYVLAVTGYAVSAWTAPTKPVLAEDKSFSCPRFLATAHTAPVASTASAAGSPGKPWAVILVGNPQRNAVMTEYQMVKGAYSGILGREHPSVVHKRLAGQIARYIVQIERDTRAEANNLCGKLLRAGGSCFVLANRS